MSRALSEKRRAPVERRQRLLSSGLAILLQEGVKRATVDQITEAAGVAKGTFYLYFDSKEALIAALQEQFAADMLRRAEVKLAKAADGVRLRTAEAFVKEMIEFQLERRHLQTVIYHQLPDTRHAAAVIDSDQELLARFTRLVEDGCNSGEFGCQDPKTTAALLFHAIHGGIIQIFRGGDITSTRLIAGTRELLRKALVAK